MAIAPASGVTLEHGSRGVTAGPAKLRDNASQAGRSEAAGVETVMLDMDAPDNLSSEPIVGICPDMCPGGSSFLVQDLWSFRCLQVEVKMAALLAEPLSLCPGLFQPLSAGALIVELSILV